MKSILPPAKIEKNRYVPFFKQLSIDGIKTYMINHDSILSYLSEGLLCRYENIEELLVKNYKAEKMRIYTWIFSQTLHSNIMKLPEFNRNDSSAVWFYGRERQENVIKHYRYHDGTLQYIYDNFCYDNKQYRLFEGELTSVAIEVLKEAVYQNFGTMILRTLELDPEKIEQAVYHKTSKSYIFIIEDKIYKFYGEGGTGFGEGIVCFQDTNEKTFGNKRFNYYHEEFKAFLPNIHENNGKYLTYLNSYLFDKKKKTFLSFRENVSEYKGIRNLLVESYLSFLQSNKKTECLIIEETYHNLFDEALIVLKNNEIGSSFEVHYVQLLDSDYVKSYNYAVFISDDFAYVLIWDNL